MIIINGYVKGSYNTQKCFYKWWTTSAVRILGSSSDNNHTSGLLWLWIRATLATAEWRVCMGTGCQWLPGQMQLSFHLNTLHQAWRWLSDIPAIWLVCHSSSRSSERGKVEEEEKEGGAWCTSICLTQCLSTSICLSLCAALVLFVALSLTYYLSLYEDALIHGFLSFFCPHGLLPLYLFIPLCLHPHFLVVTPLLTWHRQAVSSGKYKKEDRGEKGFECFEWSCWSIN